MMVPIDQSPGVFLAATFFRTRATGPESRRSLPLGPGCICPGPRGSASSAFRTRPASGSASGAQGPWDWAYARLFVPQPAGTVRPGEKTTLASTRVSGVFCFPGFGLFGVPRGRNYLLALGNLISFRPVRFRAWGSVIGPISGGYLGFENLAYSLSVFLARPSL